MKKPMQWKSLAMIGILAIGSFLAILTFFRDLSSAGDPTEAGEFVFISSHVVKNDAPLELASQTVEPSNNLSRATLDEFSALRRIFMATFVQEVARSRARGDFMFAGRSIDPSTVEKVRSFAQPHDTETMGPVSAFMVQLRDYPVSSSYKTIFGDVPLSSYVPPRGYVLMLTEAQLVDIRALDSVEFIFEVTPEYKIDPFLAWLAEKSKHDILVDVRVNLYAEANEQAVMQRMRTLGMEMEKADSFSGMKRLKGEVALSMLPELASIGGVEWIEKKTEMKLNNNLAVMAPRLNVETVRNIWGLEGEGQVIGHADTGLDTGNLATLHMDLRGRVIGSATWNGRGAWSDLNSHGTHTAGSIIGNGAASGGQFRGIAPKASLYHQSVGTMDKNDLNLPEDLGFLFDEAARNGAYIHSDSWGASVYGLYSSVDETVDSYVWGNQAFLPVLAAGNDGTDGYYPLGSTNHWGAPGMTIPDALKDGVVDSHSIASPALAKNVLAVGATESDRTDGPKSTRTYSNLWPAKFSVNPIKSDLATVGSLSSNGYLQGMAALSSRGPTVSGRVKPDVTAPGCDVISTRSSVSGAGTGWGVYSPNPVYFYNAGTSMACPLAAGAAALVREHLVKREGFVVPTAALIRAALINGAETLFPGQYGTGTFQEIPASSPNPVEGWGQVNVGDTLYKRGASNLFIDRIFEGTLQSGEGEQLAVTVVNTNVPLRVTLTWADYPLRPWATYTSEVVNDLDLMVETPTSNVLWGNKVENGDRVNTVERILIENPELGTYTITVAAYNIMVSGSLPALAISGGIEGLEPIVVPQLIETTTPMPEGYLALARIHSVLPFTITNPVDFAWAIGDGNSATGLWTHASVVADEDDQTYQTTISGPLVVGDVYYVWDVPGTAMPLTNQFSIVPYEVLPAQFSQIFGYVGGATNLAVVANTEWFLESTNDWIDVFSGAGTNAGIATFNVVTNYLAAPRTGFLLLFGGDVTNTVSVLQGPWNKQPEIPMLASPVFSMSGNQVSLSFMGERNVIYTLQGKVMLSDVEWTDLDAQTIYNNGVVTLVATALNFDGYTTLPDTAFFRIKAVALVSE